ncbi:MAG: amino acid permease, partial [Rhizobiales bacterium]|nr:amino acid permease [Hyphomicrobiales bacterium]
LTLIGASLVYLLVTYVAVWSVPPDQLAASRAPLSLVFERTTGFSPAVITLIAIVATLNGVIVQMVMSARVLYGLAKQGSLPEVFGRVSAATRTPVYSTLAVVSTILVLALFLPLEALAEASSFTVLTSFTLVNLALIKLKWSGRPAPANAFIVSIWIPIVGFISCLAFLAGSIAARFDAI